MLALYKYVVAVEKKDGEKERRKRVYIPSGFMQRNYYLESQTRKGHHRALFLFEPFFLMPPPPFFTLPHKAGSSDNIGNPVRFDRWNGVCFFLRTFSVIDGYKHRRSMKGKV